MRQKVPGFLVIIITLMALSQSAISHSLGGLQGDP